MNRQRGFVGSMLLWSAVVSLVVFSLFPIVQLVSISFKPQQEWGEVNFIPNQPVLSNYKMVLGIKDTSIEGRLNIFTQQLHLGGLVELPSGVESELISQVSVWLEQTADPSEFIGRFAELSSSLEVVQADVLAILEQEGFSFEDANHIVRNGIQPPVPVQALKLLARTDSKPEKQIEILNKFTKSGLNFAAFFRNSLLFSFISSFIAIVLAIFGSYALARLSFFGRSFISRGVLLTYMIGGILLLVPLFQMASQFGFLATPWRRAVFVLAIYVMQTLPVSLYMLGNYFRTVSFALEEAAAMDGYGRLETIFKVILPLSMPMIGTVFVYCFVIAWNEYLFMASFLKEYNSFWTLPIILSDLVNSANSIDGMVSAASILMLIPVVILFGFAVSRITSGLSEGGVKE